MYNVSSTKTRQSNNGAVQSSRSPRHAGVDKWRGSWNGNKFAPSCNAGSVLYFPGHPETDSTITDFSGSGNHGTITGAVRKRLPSGLTYFYYDGNDDRINCGNNASFNITDDLTLMAWIKTTIPQLVWSDVISKSGAYSFSINGVSSKLYFSLVVGAAQKYRYLNTALTDTWTFVAGVHTHSTGAIDCYANGVLDNGASDLPAADAEIDVTVGSVLIGNLAALNGGFLGDISLPRVLNTALTATEVANIFNNERSLFNV
jgi:hypothetical protein